MKAVEAGVDIIDTAISPFSGGTSQPPTESLSLTFSQMERNPGLNMEKLLEVSDYFKPIRDKYIKSGTLNPKVLLTEPKTLKYQVPGGMLSNLLSQLKEQNKEDKYEDVLNEVPRVRKEMGYPPLVTPLSQMVGTQAVMNVISGQRYKLVPNEIKEYLHGNYGKSPAEVDEAIKKQIIGDDEVITYRPADKIEPQFEALKEKYKDLVKSDEDVLTCALFEAKAVKFLTQRDKVETDEVIEVNLIIG